MPSITINSRRRTGPPPPPLIRMLENLDLDEVSVLYEIWGTTTILSHLDKKMKAELGNYLAAKLVLAELLGYNHHAFFNIGDWYSTRIKKLLIHLNVPNSKLALFDLTM